MDVTTSAAQEAGTDTSKKTDVAANFNSAIDGSGNNNRGTGRFGVGGSNRYSGTGKTSRNSNVRATISAVITEVLDNGNLVVSGEHSVNVNDETETIRLEGQVRPQDISAANSVYSYQLAKAQISVKGNGVVGANQTPGLLAKLFGWLF